MNGTQIQIGAGAPKAPAAQRGFATSRLHGFTAARLHGCTATQLHGYARLNIQAMPPLIEMTWPVM